MEAVARVEEVTEVLLNLLAAGELSVFDIGIVSPYSAQVQSLRQHIRALPEWMLAQRGVDLTGGGSWSKKKALRDLEIASIDAFQGREKEAIIFSAVRSNWHGQVGFLADWRRLNVMLTRARRGLVVVGNANTLHHNQIWGRWLESAPRADASKGVDADPEQASPPWEQDDATFKDASCLGGVAVDDWGMSQWSLRVPWKSW